jgi:predicted GNAT family N-acyltransferase
VSVHVRRGRDESDVQASLALRTEVFVAEQGVAPEEEVDDRDGEALHLLAFDGAELVGTCRLLFDDGERVKLGRMAVRRERRGQGIAALLLDQADAEARKAGAARIVLGAQLPAVSVYERAGYERRGEVFLEAGIEHVWMEKALG